MVPSFSNSTGDETVDELGGFRKLLEESRSFIMATESVGRRFMIVFCILGSGTVIVNATVFTTLVLNAKRLLKQAFYILVANSAIIDSIRGVCLIMWSLRVIMPTNSNLNARLIAMKITQASAFILRFANMIVILNLMLITLNEWFFIRHGLFYYKLVKKKRVLAVVATCWIFCLLTVVAEAMAEFSVPDRHALMVRSDIGDSNSTMIQASEIRRDSSNISELLDLNNVFSLIILGFCVLIALIVIICYFSVMRVVRAIQQQDNAVQDEMRRFSSTSVARHEMRKIGRRYKYLIVIGCVILTYFLYLIPYVVVQVFYVFYSLRKDYSERDQYQFVIVRLILQLLFGLHAFIQPLCYLRSKEYREIFVHFCRNFIFCKWRMLANYHRRSTSEYESNYAVIQEQARKPDDEVKPDAACYCNGQFNETPTPFHDQCECRSRQTEC